MLLVMSLAWPADGIAQSPPKSKLEGMWSDPPVTIMARFCASWCTDAGIERLNALLDNPANDGKSSLSSAPRQAPTRTTATSRAA